MPHVCPQTLLMAHALHRVSLSTARPVDAQFAFVSHNPGSADAQLYCHVFKARHARAVREVQSEVPSDAPLRSLQQSHI